MIPRADFGTVDAGQIQAYLTGSEGCFIVDGVYPASTCSLLVAGHDSLLPYDQQYGLLRLSPDGSYRLLRARRDGNVHTASYDAGPMSDIMHVLLPAVYLDSCIFSVVNTGSAGMDLHRDHDMPIVRTDPPVCIIAVVNLNDTTDADGPTQVVLGTHMTEGAPPPESPVDNFTSSAGSVLLMHGRLIHGSGENSMNNQRVNLVSSYVSYLTVVNADLMPFT